MINIFRGDDTVFAGSKFLTFTVRTGLDLTGWKAIFTLGAITKTIEDIKDRVFEVELTHEETNKLWYGELYGCIKLVDNDGHIKTACNKIPFSVTNEVIENEYQVIDLTVPNSCEVDLILSVSTPSAGGGAVESVNGYTGNVYLTAQDVGALPDTTVIPTKISDLENDSDFVVVDDLPTATSQLVNDSNFAYSDDIPTKTSQLENDSDFAQTKDIPTLLSQLKNDLGYQTLADVMGIIASIPQFKISIVNDLPITGEKMTLYLVPKEGTDEDIYGEFIWIEETSEFELIGTTAVDLTDYVKNTDYATQTKAGVVKMWTTTEDGKLGLNISTEV